MEYNHSVADDNKKTNFYSVRASGYKIEVARGWSFKGATQILGKYSDLDEASHALAKRAVRHFPASLLDNAINFSHSTENKNSNEPGVFAKSFLHAAASSPMIPFGAVPDN